VVTRAYLLKKPAAPSAQKVFLDQVVIPRAIDTVAAVEAGLEKLSLATRRSPAASLAAATGLGWLLATAGRAILRRRVKEGRPSFLKKRSKKLLTICAAPPNWPF